MDGRGDYVEGRFAGELYDVFAEVCFDGFDAGLFKALIQAHFFGDHGFALDDSLYTLGGGEFCYIASCFFGVFGEENSAPCLADVFFSHSEVDVEVFQRVRLDCAATVPEFFPVFRGGGCV